MSRPCSDPRCPQVRIVNHTHDRSTMPEPTYRRASQCSESACVEVAIPAGYRAATDCGSTTCVEVNRDFTDHDLVLVRDSKDPDGVRLSFTLAEWRTFLRGVKEGQFDV